MPDTESVDRSPGSHITKGIMAPSHSDSFSDDEQYAPKPTFPPILRAVNLIGEFSSTLVAHFLASAGSHPSVVGFGGYGSTDTVTVLGRVLMMRNDDQRQSLFDHRGWRQFFDAQVPGQPVLVTVGTTRTLCFADADGYIHATIQDHDLPQGWHTAWIQVLHAGDLLKFGISGNDNVAFRLAAQKDHRMPDNHPCKAAPDSTNHIFPEHAKHSARQPSYVSHTHEKNVAFHRRKQDALPAIPHKSGIFYRVDQKPSSIVLPDTTEVSVTDSSRLLHRFGLQSAISGKNHQNRLPHLSSTLKRHRQAVTRHLLNKPYQKTIKPIRAGVPVPVQIRVIGKSEHVGVISDLDDTVMVSMVPRLFLAARLSLLDRISDRQAVPGMSRLLTTLAGPKIRCAPPTPDPSPDEKKAATDSPTDSPVIYLSTGAWNVQPAVRDFLRRMGFPRGSFLMTDFGPSRHAWFRSGQAHKRYQLRRIANQLPHIKWFLVGDDGQHDPEIYAEFARHYPDRVIAIAIRSLTGFEQVLAHGTSAPLMPQALATVPPSIPVFFGPSGDDLLEKIEPFLEQK